jgi:acyl dehydratase
VAPHVLLIVGQPEDLVARAGTPLGVSGRHVLRQEEVSRFAAQSGNRAPIHVDAELAAQTPIGSTIAFRIHALVMNTMQSATEQHVG